MLHIYVCDMFVCSYLQTETESNHTESKQNKDWLINKGICMNDLPRVTAWQRNSWRLNLWALHG